MLENTKVEFGRTSDIDSWMRLVRKDAYPVINKAIWS